MKRLLPPDIKGTIRQWRIRKRREFRALEKALADYRFGSAYAPFHTNEIDQILREGRKQLRGNWKP